MITALYPVTFNSMILTKFTPKVNLGISSDNQICFMMTLTHTKLWLQMILEISRKSLKILMSSLMMKAKFTPIFLEMVGSERLNAQGVKPRSLKKKSTWNTTLRLSQTLTPRS